MKEKHLRVILIGTFHTKSGQIFWRHARALPLEENPIVCWKFCHVLHKVLRDGHSRVIQDSYRFKSRLLDLGKMWGLLKQGYGKLIQNYCSLLVSKMDFHYRVMTTNWFTHSATLSPRSLPRINASPEI